MKIKIKPYLLRLLKNNLIYIISFFILIVLNVVAIKSSIDKISKIDDHIKKLQSELSILKNKAELFQNISVENKEIDENITFLNTLIPNVEDYFSIISSLETLSQKTGFIITNYSVNISSTTKEKLKLTVSGEGDSQSFISFLKNYNFSGGRLITAEKIDLAPDQIGDVKINLTFYSKNINNLTNTTISNNKKIFQDLESIKKKISFNFDELVNMENIDPNYPKKTNPF